MSRVSTYLNFMGDTEQAFTFYASVFGTEFVRADPALRRHAGRARARPSCPSTSGRKVLHVELPILAGHVIMGTDMLESMGHELRVGNNTTLNLEPDTREEAERLFAALSEGGADTHRPQPHALGLAVGHLPRPVRRAVDVQRGARGLTGRRPGTVAGPAPRRPGRQRATTGRCEPPHCWSWTSRTGSSPGCPTGRRRCSLERVGAPAGRPGRPGSPWSTCGSASGPGGADMQPAEPGVLGDGRPRGAWGSTTRPPRSTRRWRRRRTTWWWSRSG